MVRGRVVVVVGGVMPTQGDGNTVYKAKDHSCDAFVIKNDLANLNMEMSSRAMESRMR